ncbi:MAG: hypothetical protein HY321_05475 [Armatimonadetes bacterium]|nr:hypothetical protein [Armatimonadota bacterium]
MSVRWLKALAVVAAAASVAVAIGRRRQEAPVGDSPGAGGEPVGEVRTPEPQPAGAGADRSEDAAPSEAPGVAAEAPAQPDRADAVPVAPLEVAMAVPQEDLPPPEAPSPAAPEDAPPPAAVATTMPAAAEEPPPAAVAPAAPADEVRREQAPMSDEEAATTARETALFYACEVVAERAVRGERVEILALGGADLREITPDRACVVVPLEISHRAAGRMPYTSCPALRVTLSGGPRHWRVREHQWLDRA